jgi:hypothetical protein
MTESAHLERGYRRWLRCYPRAFRRDHEAEILGVLMAAARPGQRRPELIECLDLIGGALSMRLRPRLSRSDRSTINVVKLMCVGALVELVTVFMVIVTTRDVKSSVVKRNPDLTASQWHAVLTGQLEPLVVAGGVAVGFWLYIAWSTARGHRWPRVALAIFFGLTTISLLNGLIEGSARYARADLASGIVLWLVELAAVALSLSSRTATPAPDPAPIITQEQRLGTGRR